MPFGDGTGPGGYGPMTGRAAGFCAGYAVPGYANPVFCRGFWGGGRGRGGGGGCGWRHWYYATGLTGWQRSAALSPAWGRPWSYAAPAAPPVARQQELDALKGQAEYLEQTLSEIRRRLEELQAQGTED